MNQPIPYSNIPVFHSPLICPVCRETLLLKGRTYSCNKAHSFDLAKEGYINLLLSHQRKSKNPGDDKSMIQARRRFFDSGAFAPLAELVKKGLRPEALDFRNSTPPKPQASSLQPIASSPTILDCGCGEGHFLGALSGTRFGVDISKEAIRCAAKRYKDATWIVANGMRELPLADQSMDVILNVLAPRNIEEFARILKPEGELILGIPGPNHLIELRSQLTDHASDFEEKADEAIAKCSPQFAETNRDLLSYSQLLNCEQIADLIQMTPIFWNSSPEAKEKVQQLDELTVTVSFVLLTLSQQRKSPRMSEPSHG